MPAEFEVTNKQVPTTGVQAPGTPAGAKQPTAPAQSEQPASLGIGGEASAPVGDTVDFSYNANADTEVLTQRQEEIQGQLDQLSGQQGQVDNSIASYDARIDHQNTVISNYEDANEQLMQSNATLNTTIVSNQMSLSGTNVALLSANGQVQRLEQQIKENSGLSGVIKWVTGSKQDVSKLESSLSYWEQQVNTLEQRQADYIQVIKQAKDQRDKNDSEINRNNILIDIVTTSKERNEEKRDALQASFEELGEKIKSGQMTLNQLAVAIKEKAAAQNIQMSDEAANAAAMSYMASSAGGAGEVDENGNPVENEDGESASGLLADYVISSDGEEGLGDSEILEDMYEMGGASEDEAHAAIQIIEAVASYQDIGLGIDYQTLSSMSINDLDGIVESAIVQNVLRTTSTRMIGGAQNITSRKDMQANSDAVNDFISDYAALNSYYQANDVDDLEAQAFLALSGNVISNINQGYVYDTTKLQEMSSSAGILLSTLKTKASSSEGTGINMSAQFQDSSAKTEDAINMAEAAIGPDADNSRVDDLRVEFLSLTETFENAEADSDMMSALRGMELLYTRAQNVSENPEDTNPFADDVLSGVVAA